MSKNERVEVDLPRSAFLFGKTHEGRWSPLLAHLLDVCAVAEELFEREPPTLRERFASMLGLPWDAAKRWILILIAAHDIGKASSDFQRKWKGAPALISKINLRFAQNLDTSHGFVSQVFLEKFLRELGWARDLAACAARAVGCHHGFSALPTALREHKDELKREDWEEIRRELLSTLISVLQPSAVPTTNDLSGPDFMCLAGITSVADWIGSNLEWFPLGTPEECNNPVTMFTTRRERAKKALDVLGWNFRKALLEKEKSFQDIFGEQRPRPLQQAVIDFVSEVSEPAVLLLEAPMGEGKTEAAFFAHLELQRRLGHRGMFVALPTRATGNAMYLRTRKFLNELHYERTLDLQLVHGGAFLNDSYQELRIHSIQDNLSDKKYEANVTAAEWFTPKKRALLSEYGVGTIDQALMGLLNVKHGFVRLWGLSNRTVVLDEVHAYDSYTGTLLIRLVQWLRSLGSSVVLLSATVTPRFKRELAKAISKVPLGEECSYPRLTILKENSVEQRPFEADQSRKRTIKIFGVRPDVASLIDLLSSDLGKGRVLILVNTVGRAQKLFNVLGEGAIVEHNGNRVGKILTDGTEALLLHSRFPAIERQGREEYCLSKFGKEASRSERRVLIATQVVEQSFDVDFDAVILDLAPIDLLLQRLGRLWRHGVQERPYSEPRAFIAGVEGDIPVDFGGELGWSSVYPEYLLLKSWLALKGAEYLTLPDAIPSLIEDCYEGEVSSAVPTELEERLSKAHCSWFGDQASHRSFANMQAIAAADDEAWKEVPIHERYEDDAKVHVDLHAKTRLGEPSIVLIPVRACDEDWKNGGSDDHNARLLFARAIAVSNPHLLRKLQADDIPNTWKENAILRNCYAFVLDERGSWIRDSSFYLNENLGLVYER